MIYQLVRHTHIAIIYIYIPYRLFDVELHRFCSVNIYMTLYIHFFVQCKTITNYPRRELTTVPLRDQQPTDAMLFSLWPILITTDSLLQHHQAATSTSTLLYVSTIACSQCVVMVSNSSYVAAMRMLNVNLSSNVFIDYDLFTYFLKPLKCKPYLNHIKYTFVQFIYDILNK